MQREADLLSTANQAPSSSRQSAARTYLYLVLLMNFLYIYTTICSIEIIRFRQRDAAFHLGYLFQEFIVGLSKSHDLNDILERVCNSCAFSAKYN